MGDCIFVKIPGILFAFQMRGHPTIKIFKQAFILSCSISSIVIYSAFTNGSNKAEHALKTGRYFYNEFIQQNYYFELPQSSFVVTSQYLQT